MGLWAIVGLWTVHCLRRRPNIKPTLVQCKVSCLLGIKGGGVIFTPYPTLSYQWVSQTLVTRVKPYPRCDEKSAVFHIGTSKFHTCTWSWWYQGGYIHKQIDNLLGDIQLAVWHGIPTNIIYIDPKLDQNMCFQCSHPSRHDTLGFCWPDVGPCLRRWPSITCRSTFQTHQQTHKTRWHYCFKRWYTVYDAGPALKQH